MPQTCHSNDKTVFYGGSPAKEPPANEPRHSQHGAILGNLAKKNSLPSLEDPLVQLVTCLIKIPAKRCREEVRAQELRQNPLPIARGYNGDCQTGSSPDSGSLLTQTFPRLTSQWHLMGLLPNTVAGPRRHSTGLPY